MGPRPRAGLLPGAGPHSGPPGPWGPVSARRPGRRPRTPGEASLRGMVLGRGEITVDAPDGLTAMADPDRLLQVVSNLIGNALRHGGDRVTVRLAARRDRAGIVIDVADTGPGIAPGDLPHVFDRFYRGSGVGDIDHDPGQIGRAHV